MAETTYTIQSRPPVRAFVIAAVGALLGALLLVLAIAQGWHLVVAILGGVLLAAGVALLIVAFMSMQRLAVHLTLYSARIAEGEPQLLEHRDLRWITPDEIGSYAFCPADEAILKKIKERDHGH